LPHELRSDSAQPDERRGVKPAPQPPSIKAEDTTGGINGPMSRPLLALLFACGGSSTATPVTPVAPQPAGDPACPVAVAGTSVTVEDTDTGAALVFVTTGDVADLRKRAALLAQKHNDHHAAMGPLPDGNDQAGGHEHNHDHGNQAHDHAAMGSMIGVHSKAVVADVDGGTKVAFISGAADLGKLQTELRMHAKHYAAGSCEMK
jgi:hypothetical protein